MNNKIGVSYAYWYKNWQADYELCIKRAAKLGLDVLEIFPQSLLEMPLSALQRLKSVAAEHNITLTIGIGLGAQYDLASDNAAVRRAGIDYMRSILTMMHQLGSHTLGGVTYGGWGLKPSGQYTKVQSQQWSIDSLKQILPLAEEYNIDYCLEVVNRFEQFLINTAQEAHDLIAQVLSPNIKISLDTFHMNIEEDDLADAIRIAGSSLAHTHLAERNRKPPEPGQLPWQGLFHAFNDINYQGALLIESFIIPDGEVARDVALWRDLSQKANDDQLDERLKQSVSFLRQLQKNI